MSMQVRPMYGYSEVDPYNDCKDDGIACFGNIVNGRTEKDVKKWAEDTFDNANKSIISYLIELPLSIASYFVSHSNYSDSFWLKTITALSRFSGALGGTFRNLNYAHRDRNGKRDDNLKAQLEVEGTKEEDSTFTLPVINNHLQTKARFITSALSLIKPELANDLDWALVHGLDSWWWRDLSMDIAYEPGFRKKLTNKILGKDSEVSWEMVRDKIERNFRNCRDSWQKYWQDNSNREGNLIEACQHTDKTISSAIPVVNVLNIIGDLSRPIARRFGIEGIPRKIIRILSVIDKPFSWVINIFRFYIPEKIIKQKNPNLKKNIFDSPHLLPISIVGEVTDFGFILFEDKIKELSKALQHSIAILRRATGSLLDIYFSARRRRALNSS